MESLQVRNFEFHLWDCHPEKLNPESLIELVAKLKTKTSELEKQLAEEKSRRSSSSSSSSIESLFKKSFNSDVEQVLAKACIIGNLPFSYVDSLWFSYLRANLFPNVNLFGRKKLTGLVDQLVSASSEKAISLVKESTKIVLAHGRYSRLPTGLCLDYWSSRNLQAFLAMIVRVITPFWKVFDVVIYVSPSVSGHDANDLRSAIAGIEILNEHPKSLRSLVPILRHSTDLITTIVILKIMLFALPSSTIIIL